MRIGGIENMHFPQSQKHIVKNQSVIGELHDRCAVKGTEVCIMTQASTPHPGHKVNCQIAKTYILEIWKHIFPAHGLAPRIKEPFLSFLG